MLILASALKGSTAAWWASALTLASITLSIAGFVLFLGAVGVGPSISLGLGVTERLAFDTLTIWSAVLGLILLTTTISGRGNTAPNGDGRRQASSTSPIG